MDQLISAACGAGSVIVCESEYVCWTLFKRRNMFFFVCQLAILSSAIATAVNGVIHLAPNLQRLPMFIVMLIVGLVMVISYPIMLLLRLRIICRFNIIFILIPIFQGILWSGLKYFWLNWMLTGNDYKIYSIIQPIATAAITAQNITISVFFMVLAKKRFENVINMKNVIIINTIAILLESVVVICEFLFLSTWLVLSIFVQIQVRLELTVLAYIVEPHRLH
jgi:hypothetical protein